MTALFADVVGSTALAESMDPEEWTLLINEGFERMAEAVYRYEGTIAQLMGDGILAFFGAPVAHEDDPERAVRAGLDMVAAVEPLDFQIRVGINTGPVVVGNVGSDLRYEYTAIGDAVNVASRMQTAARPASVLITDATYRFVTHTVEAVDRGALDVKGKSEPIHAYEVVAVSAVPGRARGVAGLTSHMIGRDKDLARLERLLAAARAGSGGVAVVVGEPGLGKTRLLAEFRKLASDVAWFEAQVPSYGRNLPYGLLLDLLRALEPLGELEDAEDQRFLAHLLGRDVGPVDLEPPALHAGYLRAARRLLRTAADGRLLVLACEDVHWADPSSADALVELLPVAGEAPLLIVCTTRPDREAPGWGVVTAARELLGDALCELTLKPLSGDDSQELVRQLLAIESLPDAIRTLILARAEGNPFFVEEVIRTLIDRAAIVRRDGEWVGTGEIATVEIPETVHGLLLGRIDRLPDDAKRVLKVASVVGRRFGVGTLREVLGDELPFAPAMNALEASGLVQLEAAEPELAYAFRHVLVQDAAYESLLKQERRRLHALVGDALERTRPDGDGELAGVLGLHFEQAGDEERALRYLVQAGEHALARFAVREAREFFSRADSHLARDSSDPDVLRRRVEVGLGRVRAGRTHIPADQDIAILEELVPVAEALGDPRLEAEVHFWLAENRRQQGDKGPGLERSLRRMEEIAGVLGDEELAALPLALRGSRKLDAAQLRAAAELFEQAVPLLERYGSLTDASYFGGLLAITYARLGEFARADGWLPRVYDLAARSGNPNAQLDADLFQGMVESERGNLEEAIELARRGAEAARQVGNTSCELTGNFVVGAQQLRQGQPELAIPALARSNDLAAYCDAGPFELLSRAWLSAAKARLGDPGQAIPGLDAALAEVRELGDPLSEAEIRRERAVALALFADPDWDAIEADFEAAVDAFERLEARPYLARALQQYGLTLETAGRRPDAEEKLRRANELFESMGMLPAPVPQG